MSLSKNTIKYIRSLHQKKYRQEHKKFLVEGEKIVDEVLRQERFHTDAVYALPEWAERHPQTPRLQVINARNLEQISQLRTPNQVLAVVEQKMPPPFASPQADEWLLYLDGIQSPSNVGAILRIADWFGFQRVIGGPGTADYFNSKTIQAGMGAFLRIRYYEGPLTDFLSHLTNVPIFGADSRGENVFSMNLPPRGLLVIGGEASGIRPETVPHIQRWLSIPRSPGGGAESLNAAVATGILCAAIQTAR